MNIQTLRLLFDSLCDLLEEQRERNILGFQTAYGLEFQEGVVMVFVFFTGTLIFRFSIDNNKLSFNPLHPLSINVCLDMVDKIEHSNSFSELFV